MAALLGSSTKILLVFGLSKLSKASGVYASEEGSEDRSTLSLGRLDARTSSAVRPGRKSATEDERARLSRGRGLFRRLAGRTSWLLSTDCGEAIGVSAVVVAAVATTDVREVLLLVVVVFRARVF